MAWWAVFSLGFQTLGIFLKDFDCDDTKLVHVVTEEYKMISKKGSYRGMKQY